MKIALLVFSDFPDGSAMGRRTHLLGKGFTSLGNEVHVVVAQRFKKGPLYEEFDGLKVYWGAYATSETFHELGERIKARWNCYKITRKLFSQGIDWLILIYPELDRLPYLLIAKKWGVKIISTYEDSRSLPPNPTIKERYLFFRGILADIIIPRITDLNLPISRFLENRLRRVVPDKPVYICPPIVDTSLFVRQTKQISSFRSKWQLTNNIIISYLGTYWYVEGLSILLAAASVLKKEGERFQLVISGKAHFGLLCDDVCALVKELDLDDVVVETGWLSSDEVVAGMSAADILVIPKLDDLVNYAGVPTKLAEYLSIGSAIVATRVGDIPFYVQDNKDVLLCVPGDSNSLADKLRMLIRDNSLRNKLCENSRKTAIKYFDFRSISKQLESMMIQQ
jgi:glycosyltransferase involved in cell wall biosynthesis